MVSQTMMSDMLGGALWPTCHKARLYELTLLSRGGLLARAIRIRAKFTHLDIAGGAPLFTLLVCVFSSQIRVIAPLPEPTRRLAGALCCWL